MKRIFVVAFIFLLNVGIVSGAAEKPAKSEKAVSIATVITQGEFAAKLVEALGWGGGLPKEPKNRDYLVILNGQRLFKFEAEKFFNKKTDAVTVRKFALFGPFSGEGWLSGISKPTPVHFKIFLPLAGEYQLSVVGKGDGQIWSVGGKEFTANSGGGFREIIVGKVFLKAGNHEITVNLPAEGALDCFTLEAPSFNPIEPIGGWRFDSPLSYGALAEIAAALLNWEKNLPVDSEVSLPPVAVYQAAKLPAGANTETVTYYGKFIAQKWVSAGLQGANLAIPFVIPKEGLYGLKVNFMGGKVVADLDGEKITRPGNPSLNWVDLGLHRLSEGVHSLTINLPPFAGIDVITFEKRKTSPADYMELVGIKGDPAASVPPAEAEKILSSLVERYNLNK